VSYSSLIEFMRSQASSQINKSELLGEVSSISPLKVKTNGIELDTDQLKVLNNQIFEVNDVVLLISVGGFFIVLGKVV
jgi:hypothetical protein